jgi:TDG/mug DNA glycosylase family protein
VKLPDIVAPDLRILFVGINPGARSGALGHHFAGKGNPFWRLLHAARLVDEPLTFLDERRLLTWRLGITNLCARTTRTAAELRPDELASGARLLQRKIKRLRPQVVALLGLTLYRQLFPSGAPGAGEKAERIGDSWLFVLPNPSGLNASFPGFREKLIWFQRLKRYSGLDAPSGSRMRRSSTGDGVP